MSTTIPVGIITHAQGAHVDAYLAALAECEEVSSVVVADPSEKWFEPARKKLGSKLRATYRDIGRMLREAKPEMAMVSMEAALAPPVIQAALEAGCHVFAEKPACVRPEDFERLAQLADSKHLHLMLALANRLNPAVREARRLIQAGKLGQIYGTEIHMVADQTRLKSKGYQQSWFAHKDRAGGGHLIWLGIHWLDLAMYLTGSSVEEVAGFAGVVGGQPLDVEDSAALAMRFDNGSFGTMTAGYYLDKGYHTLLKIWGSTGWLTYTEWLNGAAKVPLEWYSTADPKVQGIQTFARSTEPQGYPPFVRAAVRACAGLQAPPVTAREGLRVLRTIFAFYEAAKAGQIRNVQPA